MARDIIIGDIHGCFDELLRLLDELAVTDDDRLISVGDLVDRGPRSADVWEFFATRPNTVTLMGNHERKHVRGVLTYAQRIVELQMGERYDAFVAWAARLPYGLETPEAIVVHGGFEVGVPLAEQREDVLAGTTSGTRYLEGLYPGRYWTEVYAGDKPIVFGHHVVGDEPRIWQDRVYGLDTGACHGGYLSALVLPGFGLCRVPARRDYWHEQKERWQVPVLEHRDWLSRPRSKIERDVQSLGRNTRPEVMAFVERLRIWLAFVDALIPRMGPAVAARLTMLRERHDDAAFRRFVAREPSARLLFAQLAGELDEARVHALLPTPAAVLNAARELGLPTEGHESFPASVSR